MRALARLWPARSGSAVNTLRADRRAAVEVPEDYRLTDDALVHETPARERAKETP